MDISQRGINYLWRDVIDVSGIHEVEDKAAWPLAIRYSG